MDDNLNYKDQINKVCKSGRFILSNLWKISTKINSIAIKTQLIHASILSRIDYCNSMYYGLPKKEIYKLQKLQNSAVRFIYNIRDMKTHMTPFLKKSHFLPVHLRIKFKICLTVYKCLQGSGPL